MGKRKKRGGGHYCRFCGRRRANERFSGKGHRDHVCKDCQRIPKSHRDFMDQQDEITGFLCQSNISLKNIKRLEEIIESADSETCRMAQIVRDVARVRSHRRKRIGMLARNGRQDLIDELEELGLIELHFLW